MKIVAILLVGSLAWAGDTHKSENKLDVQSSATAKIRGASKFATGGGLIAISLQSSRKLSALQRLSFELQTLKGPDAALSTLRSRREFLETMIQESKEHGVEINASKVQKEIAAIDKRIHAYTKTMNVDGLINTKVLDAKTQTRIIDIENQQKQLSKELLSEVNSHGKILHPGRVRTQIVRAVGTYAGFALLINGAGEVVQSAEVDLAPETPNQVSVPQAKE